MKKVGFVIGLLLVLSFSASAQDNSKADVFGGYSFLRYSPGGGAASINFNGGIGSVAFNLTPHIAGVGEFSGNHTSSIQGAPGVSVNALTYLFGPKVYARSGRITPFAEALLGGAHASCSGCGGGPSTNTFAMALGGGVDWNASPRFGVRLGQLDYVLTRFSAASGFSGSSSQNSFRYSAGVVIHF